MSDKPPVIDAEVYLLRLEQSIEILRQKMMISAAPDRQIYYGMALGMLSSIRQAELISESEFIQRTDDLAADLGADG